MKGLRWAVSAIGRRRAWPFPPAATGRAGVRVGGSWLPEGLAATPDPRSAALRLHHRLRGRLPPRAALRPAQRPGGDPPGRAQVRPRAPATRGRVRAGHRYLVPHPGGHHPPGGHRQRERAGPARGRGVSAGESGAGRGGESGAGRGGAGRGARPRQPPRPSCWLSRPTCRRAPTTSGAAPATCAAPSTSRWRAPRPLLPPRPTARAAEAVPGAGLLPGGAGLGGPRAPRFPPPGPLQPGCCPAGGVVITNPIPSMGTSFFTFSSSS